MLLKYIFAFFLALLLNTGFAYCNSIDSLNNIILTSKIDTTKAKACLALAELVYGSDLNQTKKLINTAYELSKKNNFARGTSQSLAWLGFLTEHEGDLKEAVKYYRLSIPILIQQKLNIDLATVYNNLSNIFLQLGDHKNGIEYSLKALKMSEDMKDFAGQSYTSNNIAKFYLETKHMAKAKMFFQKSLSSAISSKDNSLIGYGYANYAGYLYTIKLYDSSEVYYNKSINFFNKANNLYGVTLAYENLATLYSRKNEFKKARDLLVICLKIKLELNDQPGLIKLYRVIGTNESDLGNLANAEAYYNKSISLSRKLNIVEDLPSIMKNYADVLFENKKFDKAYNYLYESMRLDDSIHSANRTKEVLEMETKYQADKKDFEIKNLTDKNLLEIRAKDAERKQKQNQLILFSVTIILLALFIFYGVKQYRNMQRAWLLIDKQKQEIVHKNHIVEEKNKEITDSINYAKRIQNSFFASKKLLDKNLSEYFVLYKPKDIVSGDFYWSIEIDNKLFIATADCTGHGIPGAFMSLLNISLLNEALHSRNYRDTGEILNFVRKIIITGLKSEEESEAGGSDGMDVVLCCYDLETLTLTYSAANNPLWLIRNGEMLEHKAQKMPVGKSPTQDVDFIQNTIQLQKGDIVYTFSDGYSDQFGGPNGKKFKSKNMSSLVLKNSKLGMENQKIALDKNIEDWMTGYEQIDDILVIGIKV